MKFSPKPGAIGQSTSASDRQPQQLVNAELREENAKLKDQLASVQAENKRLQAEVNSAKETMADSSQTELTKQKAEIEELTAQVASLKVKSNKSFFPKNKTLAIYPNELPDAGVRRIAEATHDPQAGKDSWLQYLAVGQIGEIGITSLTEVISQGTWPALQIISVGAMYEPKDKNEPGVINDLLAACERRNLALWFV